MIVKKSVGFIGMNCEESLRGCSFHLGVSFPFGLDQ
jgi:hypothetical protein